ncbi:MAG: NB-ARC domain-containing protein [Oculatellaceae cyanobacterium Prado106]|jgi:WD40 repeat protein|nr:NB-ARC domain-containing protein [Oculatellaceae cyanobacterium Prado106]
MARPNYGPQTKQRTKRLLEALLTYANEDWETEIRLPIRLNWQTERQLVVRTKVRFLVELTAQDTYPGKLTPEQVREALKRLQDFVGMLEDNRPATQGSEDWHFTLKLWHRRQERTANLQRFDTEWEQRRSLKSKQATHEVQPSHHIPQQDWADAPEVTAFYGRTTELDTLEQWITADNIRLALILGMGGVGKTTLAIKAAERVQNQFDTVIWRSLRNAPPIDRLLADFIQVLSAPDRPLADTLDGQIIQLLESLRQTRCLMVLDNLESVLQGSDRTGTYRGGYEGYGQLLRCVTESQHQSCILVTSREQPRGLMKGNQTAAMRVLSLPGLTPAEGKALLQAEGLSVTTPPAQTLIDRYAGNPLALRLAVPTILERFQGRIGQFLEYGAIVFGDISDLLDQQFDRLSPLEHQVMMAIAVNREPIALTPLQQDFLPPISLQTLLETIDSLCRRSLIEQSAVDGSDTEDRMAFLSFTQQPVVMEYVTQRLIDQMSEEILNLKVEQFDRQFLLNAQSKDYIQTAQIQFLLKPIAERLQQQFGNQPNTIHWLNQYLAQIKSTATQKTGYAAGNLLNLLWVMGADLSGYDFSRLAIWKVYLQGMQLHRVNFQQADLSKSVFTQISGDILSVVFSPNGTLLATGIDRSIVIWQIAVSQQRFSLKGHTAWVTAIAFSPTSQSLASGSHDQTVRLWDIETQCHKVLQGHTSWVQALAYNATGTLLASGGNDKEIRLWQTQTGDCIQILRGHTSRILSVLFHPQEPILISSSGDRTIKLWDIESGRCLQTFEIAVNWALALAIHPEGNAIATANDQTKVQFWDLKTGTNIGELSNYQTLVWAVAYRPDGQQLATAGEDKTIRVWDSETKNCLKVLSGHRDRVWLVRFSPDGETIASASDDQTIKLWDTQTGHCLKTLKTYSHEVLSVALPPVDQYLASSSSDGIIRLWDLKTLTCVRQLRGHTQVVAAIACEKNWLASGSDDGTVRLWNVQTGNCLHQLAGHTHWVQTICFSPNGQKVLSGSHDQTLKLWDTETGTCLRTFQGHHHRVKAVAFHPSGTLLASASDDQTIKLWQPETGECLDTLQGHIDWVLAIAFSPCGTWLASASGDRTVKLWNLPSKECLYTLEEHQNRVRSVAFSPDGRWLASGGEDAVICLWEVSTGTCLNILSGHTQIIWSLVWSSDGQRLISCSEDGTIRVWQPETGDCLQILRSDRPYEDLNIADVTGLTDTQIATLKALGAVEQF